MRKIKNFKVTDIPFDKIAIVATSEQDYEMDRTILVEYYPDYGGHTVVHGSHCSCYGFDEVEWEAIIYTTAQIRKLAIGWLKSGYGSEGIIAPLILNYIEA